MKLQIFGDYVFEFILITILMSVSIVLVVPFVPILIGITGYFSNDIHSRRYKDIFLHIKNNWKILIPYSVFQLLIIIFPVLNIYYFNTHPDNINSFIYVSCYVLLILGLIYLITAPTIIINMNTNFKQLIFNGIVLLFGKIKNSLISILIMAIFITLIFFFPYVIILTLYFMILFIRSLMIENLYNLKAKSLGVSVEELTKTPNDDDYIDEINNR